MPDLRPEHVQNITGFEALLQLLAERLYWPLEEAELEDVTFQEDLAEIGLDPDSVESVRQLRPMESDQPWGILLLRFERRKLPVTVLRKILRFFARKQIVRSEAAGRATWRINHILFVIDHGVDDDRQFSFAHFDGTHAHNAKLSIFGWKPGEPCRTLVEHNLPALEWPDDSSDHDAWVAAWSAAFDVEKVTERFFADFKRLFEMTREHISPAFAGDDDACHDFTQRLFNRLLFATFIQKKRWLDNDTRYLFNRFEQVTDAGLNYYDDFLHRLFFWALRSEPEQRDNSDIAEWTLEHLGDVPFLNGGLFEEIDEWDVHKRVPIANEVFASIFNDLLDHYNFTVTESTPLDIEVAIDPEMLGKVFEELVTGRHESGSFYTPKPVVAFMCREALKGYLAGEMPDEQPDAIATLVEQHDPQGLHDPEGVLDALRRVRVCDPACGSGAYLLGMLQELVALRGCLFAVQSLDEGSLHERKLEIIQNNLYGVDMDPFAVNIARLRLWLSLAVDFEGEAPPPLPNLDMKIEIGDSLTAPAPDFGDSLFRDQLVREADRLAELKDRYLTSHGTEKRELKQEIEDAEEELKEFFQDQPAPEGALDWRIAFPEVFIEGGFDIVLANPPYVRQELIGPSKDTLRELYPDATTGKSDLYCYFYARGLQLLRPGGQHVFICSNSWLDVGYGGKLQAYLLDHAHIKAIYDSAVERQFATADINTIISHLERAPRVFDSEADARLTRFIYLKAPFEEALAHPELRREIIRSQTQLREAGGGAHGDKYKGDKWGGKYLRAPDIYWRILEKAGDKLVRLGDIADVRFGIKTGANEFFFVKVIGPEDADTVTIEAGDGSTHRIEAEFVTWPVLTKARELARPVISPGGLPHRLLTITRRVDESCPLASEY
ncbi:MAG: Eco57I restriction-modification methylase domain-containing protein, partial [Armatimonadetes bacterium]|nr:Eco57I restriction-modification methylase domain-containing protein [Armatimonadota bacterium]